MCQSKDSGFKLDKRWIFREFSTLLLFSSIVPKLTKCAFHLSAFFALLPLLSCLDSCCTTEHLTQNILNLGQQATSMLVRPDSRNVIKIVL
ncbi:hypothetical protein DXV75_03480 [Alteromonas aestuariivivens]|uniref:Uncharacterized protein n=1 Tax=Alteromonas aestuariivivens TaxID=1938339 RepID=A0A3D8MCT4_9ALTE|nr:hypothetical protein DXV75_03480 [Alteromonas aestuariivivens]